MSTVARSGDVGVLRDSNTGSRVDGPNVASGVRRKNARKEFFRKGMNQVIFYAALLGAWAVLAKLRVWPQGRPKPFETRSVLW